MPKGEHLRKHGLVGHPLYKTWRGMMQRCRDPNSKAYRYYGARGIDVCARWSDFAAFLSDMGEPPTGYMLDRIDGNRGYSPDNCRWVTRSEQMKNRSISVRITYNGRTQNLVDWARELDLNPASLKYRLAAWPLAQALSTPKGR